MGGLASPAPYAVIVEALNQGEPKFVKAPIQEEPRLLRLQFRESLVMLGSILGRA